MSCNEEKENDFRFARQNGYFCIILTRLAFSREICAPKWIFLYYFNAPCVFTRNLRANLDLDFDLELD